MAHLTSHSFRTVVTLALVVAPLAGCGRGGSAVRGSGTIKTETRTVSGFSHIVLAGEGDLTITQTGTESLQIDADDNLLPLITSTVSGSNLDLKTTTSVRPSKPIHYTLTVKDFTGFDLSGSGNATATKINATTVKVVLSGSGDAKLTGQTQSEDVTISGAGSYEASGLASKTAKVVISGAGDAVVQASETLDARVSGAGSIAYIGDPKLTQSVTGAGTIHKR